MRTEHVKRNIDTNTSSSQNLSCELLFYVRWFPFSSFYSDLSIKKNLNKKGDAS